MAGASGQNVVELILRAIDATQGVPSKVREELDRLRESTGSVGSAGQAMGAEVAAGSQQAAEAMSGVLYIADAAGNVVGMTGQKAAEATSQAASGMAEMAQAADAAGDAAQQMGQQAARAGAEAKRGGQQAREGAEDAEEAAKKAERAWKTLALATAGAFAGLTVAVRESNQAAIELQAAQMGLQSALQATGTSADRAKKFLEAYTADGLVSLGAASSALQNLLMRYQDLDVAIAIMERLKDSAAFNRQAHLSLEAAVVSATEGLKNENSILVDNAGVTKNVSVMWKEYAEQIGVGVGSLTQAQKAEAEYQGILRETAHQVGNASRLAGTAAGAQALLTAQTIQAKQAYGEALQPAIKLVTEGLTDLLAAGTALARSQPELVAGLTAAALAMFGIIGAIAAYKAVIPPAIAATKALEISLMGLQLKGLGLIGVISVLVGALAAWAVSASQRSKDVSQEQDDVAKAYEDAQRRIKDALQSGVAAQQRAADAEKQISEARQRGAEQARQQIVREIDRLHDALVSALRKRYQQEEQVERDALRVQQQRATDAHRERLRLIEDEGRARIAAIQEQIDALDELGREQDRLWRDEDRQKRIRELQDELARTSDPEQALRIMRSILEEQEQLVRDHERDIREDRRRALQDQIADTRDALDKRKEAADAEYEQERLHLDALEEQRRAYWQARMDSMAIEAEVEAMFLADNQQAMLELLKEFEPGYFNAGKSFGERLLDGLVGTQPDYEAALQESLTMIHEAETLIREAADRAEAEARRVAEAAQAALDAALDMEFPDFDTQPEPDSNKRPWWLIPGWTGAMTGGWSNIPPAGEEPLRSTPVDLRKYDEEVQRRMSQYGGQSGAGGVVIQGPVNINTQQLDVRQLEEELKREAALFSPY